MILVPLPKVKQHCAKDQMCVKWAQRYFWFQWKSSIVEKFKFLECDGISLGHCQCSSQVTLPTNTLSFARSLNFDLIMNVCLCWRFNYLDVYCVQCTQLRWWGFAPERRSSHDFGRWETAKKHSQRAVVMSWRQGKNYKATRTCHWMISSNAGNFHSQVICSCTAKLIAIKDKFFSFIIL